MKNERTIVSTNEGLFQCISQTHFRIFKRKEEHLMTDFHLLQARFWFLTDNRIKINVAQPPIKKKMMWQPGSTSNARLVIFIYLFP